MIQMTIEFEVPFDDEVESLSDVCDEITDGLDITWAYGFDYTNIIRFTGTRESIMMFLGRYEPDAYADDQL